MSAQVTAREMRETVTTFDTDDAALLFAVRESLRLLGIHCEVVLGDGRRLKIWTWTPEPRDPTPPLEVPDAD